MADSILIDEWASGGIIVTPDSTKIIEGWQLGEQPPHEYMNYLQNLFSTKINHILKNGVIEWNNMTEYPINAFVSHSNRIWRCKTINTNSEPSTTNSNWEDPFIKKFVHVSRNTDLVIASGSPVKITFPNVIEDTNGLFNSSTSLVTIDEAGKYDVRACVHLTPSASHGSFIHILVNGVLTGNSKSGSGGLHDATRSFVASAIIDVEVGDTVGIYMFTGASNTITTFSDNNHCYFQLKQL